MKCMHEPLDLDKEAGIKSDDPLTLVRHGPIVVRLCEKCGLLYWQRKAPKRKDRTDG